LSGSADSTIKLWDIQSGKEIRSFKGHTNEVTSVCFSPDGRYALSGSYDKTLKLWDINNGKEIRSFKGHAGPVYSVCFSPDGRYALSGSYDNTIKLWDFNNGKEIRSFKGHTYVVTSVSFSPDGRYALSGSLDNTLKLWDIQSGKEIRSFKGHTHEVTSVCFSPDGRYALSGSIDKTLKLWDIQSGKEIKSFEGHTGIVTSVCFSPDGRYALSGSADSTIKLWDIQSVKEIKSFEGHTDWVTSVCFSPDGRYALSGSADSTIKLWDIQTGEKLKSITGNNNFISCVCFSLDGRYALSGSWDHTIKLWDINNGKEIRSFKGHTDVVSSVCFSPDGRYALSGSDDKTLKLWDIQSGKEIKSFEGHTGIVNSVCFSPDGRYALSGSGDKTLKLWDINNGKEIRSFKGHTDVVTPVCFSPDGRYALSGSWDHTIKLWDIQSGKEIVTFISVDSNDFITLTPGYYYYCSKNANTKLAWRIGLNIFGFDQFDLQYNRPDIVLERIGYAPKELIDSYRKAYYKRLKKMNFDENKFSPEFHVPKIKILNIDSILPTADRSLLTFKIKVTDSKYKIDRINLWVNDVPVYGMNGLNLRGQKKDSLVMEIPLNLSVGVSKVQVSCRNEKGVESLKENFEIRYEPSTPEKSNEYFVGIGVSNYKDQRLNLTYSVKDIRDLATLFKEKNADLIIDTLLNNSVTRENVLNLKKKLYNTKIDDEVIMAISGHGFLSDSLDFYYGTYDIDYTHPEVKGLSYDDIEWLLDSIPARKKLVLMDACHSGEVDKEEKNKIGETIADNEKGLSLIPDSSSIGLQNIFELMQDLFTNLSKGNGAVVISAARGQGAALEGKEWNNGVFTHCILNGLKDGKTSVNELKEYVSKEVEVLTNGRQKPTSRVENLENDWKIW
jgi:WD40 repeat protein